MLAHVPSLAVAFSLATQSVDQFNSAVLPVLAMCVGAGQVDSSLERIPGMPVASEPMVLGEARGHVWLKLHQRFKQCYS